MPDLQIGKKYLRFFLKNLKTRHVILIGGRRSAKSFSVYKFLTLRASGKDPLHIMVVAASFPAVQLAIKDFQQATGLQVEGSTLLGQHCKLPNGSIFQFKSYDVGTKAQGDSCDIMVCEEALNIDEQVLNVAMLGVRRQIYMIMNPTRGGFVDKYILPDKSNMIVTTFKDNPFLGEAQIEEFELMKEKALSPTASPIDKFNYNVYYKGEFSEMSGKIFKLIHTITDEEFDNIPVQAAYGMDFGWTDGNDETTLVAIKLYKNNLYAREILYSKGLANDKQLALTLYDLGFDCYDTIVADVGGMGKTRITNLCTAGNYEWTEEGINKGFNIVNAKKTRVIDGIQEILNCDGIFVTETSTNLRNEMDKYELELGSTKGKDHLIDALRYAFHYSKMNIF